MILSYNVKWCQIDCTLSEAYYPTVVRPQVRSAIGEKTEGSRVFMDTLNLHPSFNALWGSVRMKAPNKEDLDRKLTEIPLVAIRIAPIAICVDVIMLRALLRFVDGVLTTFVSNYGFKGVWDVRTSETAPESEAWTRLLGPVGVRDNAPSSLSKVYISYFDVGPLDFLLNIKSGLDPSDSDDGPKTALDLSTDLSVGTGDHDEPHSEIIRGVLALLDLKASISDARLTLSARLEKDLCGLSGYLVTQIVSTYLSELVVQTHKVLGAMDLLGNPTNVLRRVTHGTTFAVMDVRKGIDEMRRGRLSAGWQYWIRGSRSCVFGGTMAAFDFFARCFGSWFGILDMASGNDDQFSILPYAVRDRSIGEEPVGCLAGSVQGCTACWKYIAVSLLNILFKPTKAMWLHASAGKCKQRWMGECAWQGCSGAASGCRSVLGVPAGVLLWGELSCVGLLNRLAQPEPSLPVRPRRVFLSPEWNLRPAEALIAGWHSDLEKLRIDVAHKAKHVAFAVHLPEHAGKEQSTSARESSFLAVGTKRIGYFHRGRFRWTVNITDVDCFDVAVSSRAREGGRRAWGRFFCKGPGGEVTPHVFRVRRVESAPVLFEFLCQVFR
eukprot:Polyplicarium_translucidae@DN3418_c0_g1_i1.p1